MYTGGIFQVAEHHLAGYSIARDYLKMTDDAWLSVCDPEYTVRKLNEGFFHSLLTGYVQKDGIELSSGLGKRAVFLGAYAMELGVVIGKDDMDILRAAFDKTKMHRTAIAQMNEALTHYKSNGEGWDFEEGHHLYSKMHLSPTQSRVADSVPDGPPPNIGPLVRTGPMDHWSRPV